MVRSVLLGLGFAFAPAASYDITVALPTPPEIVKMVCEAASSEIIEREGTEEVCKLIKEKFPSVPECEATVKALWDKIKAMCPKGKQTAVAMPTPEEIEKMVCEAASSAIIEKEGTEEVCKLIKEKFPSVPDCEATVKALWDKIKAMCPKGKQTAVAMPTPEEIEKMVCEAASSAIIEKEGTEEVCKLIKEKFPSVPECEATVKALWDKIKAMCPKSDFALIV